MAYQTKKLDTSISHSIQLASDMTKGRNTSLINRLSVEGSAQGTTAIIDYRGMIYRVEIIPTYMGVVESASTVIKLGDEL